MKTETDTRLQDVDVAKAAYNAVAIASYEHTTGYEFQARYSLPRLPISMEMITGQMIFPYMVFNGKEASDRFDKIPYVRIQTMIPSETGTFHYYYNTTFIQECDYNKVMKLITYIRKTLKLKRSIDDLQSINGYLCEKYNQQYKVLKNYFEAVSQMRDIINVEISAITTGRQTEKKYQNLALGMIRYSFGISIGDCNHD